MIVDSSALVAISLSEAGSDRLLDVLASTEPCSMSAGTLLEASIVIDARRNPAASRRFDAIIENIEVVAVTAEQVRIARQAFRDFGRGSGHLAKLNFGDCFSYALAAQRREPLLYVGDDFVHTDIRSALDA